MDLEIKIKERFSKKSKAKLNKSKYKKKFSLKSILRNVLIRFLEYDICRTFLSKDTQKVVKTKYVLSSKKISKDYLILFISDLHLDVIDNTCKLKKLLSNKKYDLIILGGDYFDSEKGFCDNKNKLNLFLEKLRSHSDSIISVAGNHDDFEVLKELNKKSILLIDDFVVFNDELKVYGFEESVTFDFDEIKTTFNKSNKNNKMFNIGVSHNPISCKDLDMDLILSGHTHGGQIKILGFTPINNCKSKVQRYGMWKDNKTIGITTSGLGCSGFAVRRGVLPEIVEFKIKKEDIG